MKLTLRPDPERLVGRVGRAVTDLKPQGRVEVVGFEFDAHTSGIFYAAGTEIVVVDVDHLGLVVRVASDAGSLDALAGIRRPAYTPRWRWWEKDQPEEPSLLLGTLRCILHIGPVLLVLGVIGWLLVKLFFD